jgi:hypothetical protein
MTTRRSPRQLELDLPAFLPSRAIEPATSPSPAAMWADDGYVTTVTAWAYAAAFFQRAPAHWARPGLVAALEQRLDKVPHEKWCKTIRRTALRHVSELFPRKKKR